MVNSVSLYQTNNYQKSICKKENVAFSGKDEGDTSKSLCSNPAVQLASIGVGIAGLIAVLKTRKFTAELQTKFAKIYDELGLESPKAKNVFAKVGEMFENISKFATKDALTGLANRKTFDVALKKAVINAKETGTDVSVAFMDIDFFKRFNDVLGHRTGDDVLKSFAKILDDLAKEHPGIVQAHRCGGEEFGVIIRANQNDAEKIVAKISDKFRQDQSIQSFKKPFMDNLMIKIKELNDNKQPAQKIIEDIMTNKNMDTNDLMQRVTSFLPENLQHNRDIKSCINFLNKNPDEVNKLMVDERFKPLANLLNKFAKPEEELKQFETWLNHMKPEDAKFTLSGGLAGEKVLKNLIDKGVDVNILPAKMLEAADSALYLAKESGRNAYKIADAE